MTMVTKKDEGAMLIGQITDLHIGFDLGNPNEANLTRLESVLARLNDGPDRPDLLLLTGDLTEHGNAESYARLVEALPACPVPAWPIPGNHDQRAAMLAAFPQVRLEGGFIQYAIEQDGLRILMLDTLEPGRHGGAFCSARADWLRSELAAHPETPTLIVMHHPPFPAGIAWMDPDPEEPWVRRFAEAIGGHDQILEITCGHVHRAVVSCWQGHTTMICPSTAPAVVLNLSGIDPEHPDGRVLIADELPGFALHHWDGRRLASHLAYADSARALAIYDQSLQPMIRGILAERP